MRINRSKDWIVIEASNHNSSKTQIDTYEKILSNLNMNMIMSIDGIKRELLPSMTVVLKFDEIVNINPSFVSTMNLLYVNDNSFSLRQEFEYWLKKLIENSPFFEKNAALVIKLFENFIEPIINFAISGNNLGSLIYFLGKRYLLLNFLKIFEVLFNESRKIEIALGHISEIEIEAIQSKLVIKIFTNI